MSEFRDADAMHEPTQDEIQMTEDDPAAAGQAVSPPELPEASVLDIIADVESKLNRLRSAQSHHEQHLATLEQRAQALLGQERALALREAEVAERALAVAQEVESLDTLRLELASRDQALLERQGQLAAAEAKVGEMKTAAHEEVESLRADREALEAQKGKLDQAQELLDQHWDDLRTEREQLSALAEELEERETGIADERQRLQSEAADVQQQLKAAEEAKEALQRSADEARDRMAQAETNVGELIKKLESAGSDLEASESSLAAAREEKAALTEQLATLRNELEETTSKAASAKDELSRAASRLEQERKSLQSRCESAEAERESSRSRISDLEASQAALRTRCEEAEQERDRAQQGIQELQRKLQSAQEKSAAVKADRASIEERLEGVQNELQSSNERAAALERSRDETLARCEATEADAAALRQQVESLRKDLAARDEKIAQREATLKSAKEKLGEFAKAIGEQTDQAQRGLEAMATVRDQEQQIARLKEQLAAAKAAGDPDTVARKDERIKELTAALHQARGQSLPTGDIDERNRRIMQLEAEADELRQHLERARVEAQEARDELNAAKNDRVESSNELAAGLKAKVAALETQLEDALDQLEQARVAPHPSDGGPAADQLRRKAAQIRAAAQHLQRRRLRLERVRALMKTREKQRDEAAETRTSDRARENATDRMQMAARLEQERQTLGEAARCLADSEQAMVRKWARPRAVLTMLWIVAIGAILAGGSWVAADRLFPATVTASVAIEAKPKPGFTMSDDQAAQWQTWHSAILQDETFIRSAAKRFDDRAMESLADADALRSRLGSDIKVDSTQDGELVLSLSGTDRAELQAVLDTLAVTITSESRRQAGKRPDGLRTEIRGERQEAGRTMYASVSNAALQDDRLTYAAVIFGALCTLTLVSGIVVGRRLQRVKRILESDDIAVLGSLGLNA